MKGQTPINGIKGQTPMGLKGHTMMGGFIGNMGGGGQKGETPIHGIADGSIPVGT